MQINPVAFRLFGAPVYWYGVMISLGMLLGAVITFRRLKQYDINEDRLVSFLLLAVPLAIAGARFVFVATNWHLYAADPMSALNIREGGLSIHGGILGAIIAGIGYTQVTKVNFWRLADLCAPGLILGQAIGRWGNYFNQEAYGLETSVPWAMFIDGAYRHPTFLYEFIWNLLVLAFLLHMSKREKVDGAIFLRYIIWYSAGRFWIEGVRADALIWGHFKAGQLVSLILIHGGLLILWWRRRQSKKTMEGGHKCAT